MKSSKLLSFSLFVFLALALTRAEDRCDCASIVAEKEKSIDSMIHTTIETHQLECDKKDVHEVGEYMEQQVVDALGNDFTCPPGSPKLEAIDTPCESLTQQVVLFNAVVRNFYGLQEQACGCGCAKA
ncbi:hypothetical protein QR680_008951 [Steinernema hermaphroditum]|uniref:Uncharacterized protein n=1 Tax=Steinernema hermaphroditum TaxID=289476 RepID=A0AA39M804_9BILA|nr:hypothetical protein QR680_008951 [Steinernema hermaphroditum]